VPINKIDTDYEEKMLSKLGISYNGLTWCELGNTTFYNSYAFSGVSATDIMPAKQMYEAKGVKHTSIDINGRSGALPLNLDNPVPADLENKFDVVTNYGTTEHVDNQYSSFKNIHVMCKAGGVMLHGLSLVDNWPKHCRYYYSEQFFRGLAAVCDYEVVDVTILNTGFYKSPRNAIVCALRKNQNNAFISTIKFSTIKGMQDTKNVKKTGNYQH
jgi:hypothetical protein